MMESTSATSLQYMLSDDSVDGIRLEETPQRYQMAFIAVGKDKAVFTLSYMYGVHVAYMYAVHV